MQQAKPMALGLLLDRNAVTNWERQRSGGCDMRLDVDVVVKPSAPATRRTAFLSAS